MAWIIGLADDEEIKKILKAGYEVHDNKLLPGIDNFAKSEHPDSKGIAIFVDCDVQDLLSMEEE